MAFTNKKFSIDSFAQDVLAITPKKGVQVIELSTIEMDTVKLPASYRYTKHVKKDGSYEPVDFTLSLLRNPLMVVEGIKYIREESAKLFRKKIEKHTPWLIDIDFDTDTGRALFFWFARHPQITCEGIDNPNLNQALVKMTLRSEQALVDMESIRSKYDIISTIFSLTYEQCKSLIYHLGHKPFVKPNVYMTHSECRIFLIGKNFDGMALKKDKLFEDFISGIDTDNIVMRVTLKKALAYRIVVKQHGVMETPSGVVLGSEEESAIAYLIHNNSFYESLKADVAKAERSVPASTIPLEDAELVETAVTERRGRGRRKAQ